VNSNGGTPACSLSRRDSRPRWNLSGRRFPRRRQRCLRRERRPRRHNRPLPLRRRSRARILRRSHAHRPRRNPPSLHRQPLRRNPLRRNPPSPHHHNRPLPLRRRHPHPPLRQQPLRRPPRSQHLPASIRRSFRNFRDCSRSSAGSASVCCGGAAAMASARGTFTTAATGTRTLSR
jgi:hypothetical protein